MSVDKHSLEDCSDKDFVLKVPHDSLQKRIVTLGRESDLFLMLQIEAGYGERNQEKIIRTISEGIFEDSSLRESVFPEKVDSKDKVFPFMHENSVRSRLVNEYIQLTIANHLEKEAKRKMDYLKGYIVGRMKGNAMHKLNAMKMAITVKKVDLTPEMGKERERIVKDIDFAPTLQAEIVTFLKGQPCIPLFSMFLKQNGILKTEEEIDHFIALALENATVKTEIAGLIARIKQLRKLEKAAVKEQKKVAEPRMETRKLTFEALAPRLEGAKSNVKKQEEAPDNTDNTENTARKRKDTVRGLPVRPKEDILKDDIEFIEVDELFEEDGDEGLKPIPATLDAPVSKVPDFHSFQVPTPPPPVPISARVKAGAPSTSGHVPASTIFDEIRRAEESGLLDSAQEESTAVDKDEPVLDLDLDEYGVDTFVEGSGGSDFEDSRTNVVPPVSGVAPMAADLKPILRKLKSQPPESPQKPLVESQQEEAGKKVSIPRPKPVVRNIRTVQRPVESPVSPTPKPTPILTPLPEPAPMHVSPVVPKPAIASVQEEKRSVLIERPGEKNEEPELTTIDKFSKWVQRHITKIAGVVALSAIGTAGYYMYKNKEDVKKGDETTKLAHKTDDQKKDHIAPPPMRRLDEPTKVKPVQAVKPVVAGMKAPIIKTLPKSMDVAKPMTAPKPRPVLVAKPRVAPKPVVVQQPKTVDVKGATQVDQTLVSIDKKSLSNLPDGTYKDMWEGKSFDIQNAPHASITGFMEQHLKDMVKKLPSKKAQREAMKAYYSNLKQLERGWLIYMSEMEVSLHNKSMEGTITPQEDQRLQWWENYKQSHKNRKWQAKWLHNRYQSLKSKKQDSAAFAYYKNITEMGRELMEGLSDLNSGVVDVNNVSKGKTIRFSDGSKVLETFWRFAHAMKLPMPAKAMGSTGEVAPSHGTPMFAETNDFRQVTPPAIPDDAKVHSLDDSDILDAVPMFGAAPSHELKPILSGMTGKRNSVPPAIPDTALVHEVTDDMIVKSTPPPIPSKAVVYALKDSDIKEVPTYGMGPKPELKPILADMNSRRKAPPIPSHVRKHQPIDGKISHNDVYSEYTLERLDGGDYAEYSVKEHKPKDPMFGAAQLKHEIKPILADMVKKSQNDYAEYTVERENSDYDTYSVSHEPKKAVSELEIPRGEEPQIVPAYAELTVENRPTMATPPPIPADALAQKPKKKSLWGKVKSWFSKAA